MRWELDIPVDQVARYRLRSEHILTISHLGHQYKLKTDLESDDKLVSGTLSPCTILIRQMSTSSIISVTMTLLEQVLLDGSQLVGRAEALVRLILIEELLSIMPIEVDSFRLQVRI